MNIIVDEEDIFSMLETLQGWTLRILPKQLRSFEVCSLAMNRDPTNRYNIEYIPMKYQQEILSLHGMD
jgi:hypothetical protein